jgi:hypothetical protein
MIGKGVNRWLVLIPRHLDMDAYTEFVLRPDVAPFFSEERARCCCKCMFQQNNDGVHGNGSVLNQYQDSKNEHKTRRLRQIG